MKKRSLDERALLALRKARRKHFGAPGWADHVLSGVKMFTTAGNLARLTQSRKLESK